MRIVILHGGRRLPGKRVATSLDQLDRFTRANPEKRFEVIVYDDHGELAAHENIQNGEVVR